MKEATEALKLALEALEWCHGGEPCGTAEAITAIKEALAQPEQEPDWKEQYEHQKRRAERWIAKYEKDIGPLEKAQPAQEPLAYIRVSKTGNVMACAKTGDFYSLPDGTLLYTSPPAQQEPMAKHYVDGGHLVYPPAQRTWVGLTEEEAEWCQAPSRKETWKRMETKLKEKNAP